MNPIEPMKREAKVDPKVEKAKRRFDKNIEDRMVALAHFTSATETVSQNEDYKELKKRVKNYVKALDESATGDKELEEIISFIRDKNLNTKALETVCVASRYDESKFALLSATIFPGGSFGKLTKDQALKIWQDASLILRITNLQIEYLLGNSHATYENEGLSQYLLLSKQTYDQIAFRTITISGANHEVTPVIALPKADIEKYLEEKKPKFGILYVKDNGSLSFLRWSISNKKIVDDSKIDLTKLKDYGYNLLCVTREALEKGGTISFDTNKDKPDVYELPAVELIASRELKS